jgi:preprotein translocase subunit SecG
MSTLVTFFHVLICFLLVVVVLLQPGKGGGMGGAFGGGNAATVFGSGGASTFLRRLTAITATLFMATSMVLAWIASNDAGDALRKESARQAAIKKRKKQAEDRALEGATTPEPGTAPLDEPVPTLAPTGADVDDGDTGEDEGAAGPALEGDTVVPAEIPGADEPASP